MFPHAPLKKGRALDLLLVEDEPQVAQLLSARLARVGFNVESVSSVPAAVGALARRRYSVVLLDILLKQHGGRPTQNGLDVAREMRRRGIDAPVVVMTAFPTFEHGRDSAFLAPTAVIDKGTDLRPVVEACQAAAAALKTPADPLVRAREELAALDLSCHDAADRCSAILLRAISHPALTLFQSARLGRELVLLAKTASASDRSRLCAALETPPSSGDREVDRVLAVLASGQVASNTALAKACGSSAKTIRARLKAHTGWCTTVWRSQSRGQRFVRRLANTRDNIGQCADAAGYSYGRQSVAECRRLFGRNPTEIRRLLEL